MAEQIRNEADVLAENQTLKTQLTETTTQRDAAVAERDELKSKLDAANASVAALTTERDELKSKFGAANNTIAALTTERDGFKAQAEPLQKQLRSELLKFGISKDAPSAAAKPNVEMSVTEICAAVKDGTISAEEGNRLIEAKNKKS